MQYVDTPTGERYILRIYNNGGETDRVRFEHSVLGTYDTTIMILGYY